MREILFRGKRIDNGEWVNGYLIKSEFSEKAFIGYLDDYYIDVVEVDQKTVGQYVGIYDDKKQKIFEGDIINVCGNGGISLIVTLYQNAWMGMTSYIDKFYALRLLEKSNIFNDFYTVIGNIHDNPELLNKVVVE